MDFCIVGFPKCGTRTLIYLLKDHPQVYTYGDHPPIYEVHGERIYDLKKVSGKVTGFKHPGLVYPRNEKYMDYLLRQNPSLKIIVSLREPSDWIWAFYHYRLLGVKDLSRVHTFDDVVYHGKEVAGAKLSNGQFVDFLKPLMAKLPNPKEQLFLMRVEDLQSDYNYTIRRLLDFLGLDNLKVKQVAENVNRHKYPPKDQFTKQLFYAREYYAAGQRELEEFVIDQWSPGVTVIKPFLTESECQRFIPIVKERVSKCKGPLKTTVIPAKEVVELLEDRLLSVAPTFYTDPQGQGWLPNDVSELVHFCFYEEGSEFPVHRDRRLDENAETLREDVEIQDQFKILLYLNSTNEGGETRFHKEKENVFRVTQCIAGQAVLFHIDTLHSVGKVVKGTKSIMSFRIRYIKHK